MAHAAYGSPGAAWRSGCSVVIFPKVRIWGQPAVLFTGNYLNDPGRGQYDVAPDGKRFLMMKEDTAQQEAGQINVVLNWFEELKRLVPTN